MKPDTILKYYTIELVLNFNIVIFIVSNVRTTYCNNVVVTNSKGIILSTISDTIIALCLLECHINVAEFDLL